MAKHEDAGQPADIEGEVETSRVDAALGIYLSDSSLWPVLFAGVMAFVALGSWLMWLAVAGRNPFGGLALVLLLGMTLDLWIRDLRGRRFGATSRLIATWWGLCGIGTWVLSTHF